MGLDKVKEEVLIKSKEKANQIINEGKLEAEKLIKEAEGNVAEFKKKVDAEAKKSAEDVKKKELASSELEIKKLFLQEKKNAINKVFKEAEKRIKGLSHDERAEHVKKLLDKANKEINVKFVYCNKKDSKLVEDFEVEESDILGGIIAESDDRAVRVDYSYETILESIKEQNLQDLGNILFK